MNSKRQQPLFLLLLTPVLALADGGVCEISSQAVDPDVEAWKSWATLPEDTIEITADHAELNRQGEGLVSGNVRLRKNELALLAEQASFSTSRETFKLSGNVRFIAPGLVLRGDDAAFSSSTENISFRNSEFVFPQVPARGTAGLMDAPSEGVIRLEDVTFTTCPEGRDDWMLSASHIEMDKDKGRGKAKGAKFEFKGVPILYAPVFTFPLSDARKTGLLIPKFGSNSRVGTEVEIPVYFNLAPNYDFTLTPNWMSKRGVQITNEFRYLSEINTGHLKLEYLRDDNVTGEDRILGNAWHQTRWRNGWWATLDVTNVSDGGYFEDLGGSLAVTSLTQLERNLQLEYHGSAWSAMARVENFQTIDESIVPEDRPYTRLPQLLARGYWPDAALGLDYVLDSELVYFDRNVGITGSRVNVTPQVSLPLGRPSLYLTPSLSWEYTRYQLVNTLAGEEESPSRNTPIFSVDSGLVLDRATGGKKRLISTLEPRLQYVYIPYRDQDNLPVFDTGIPDLNLVQLFRRDRFAGPDRVGDASRLAAGLSTRLLDPDNGRQYLAATLGGQYFFKNQRVTLPGELPESRSSSDVFAELNFGFFNKWNLGAAYQWDPDQTLTKKSVYRVQYKPGRNEVINLAYRFQRSVLEQADLSFSWPLGSRWNAVGRWNWSLRDQQTLESFFGLEYESCCWGIRVVGRRFIADRTGDYDISWLLQVNFKGLSSLGSSAGKMLEHGILGYETD